MSFRLMGGACLVLALAAGCTGTLTTGSRPSTSAQVNREVTGRVAGYTTAPLGEMNGVILDNGTRVHFPPQIGATVLPLVQRGELVRVIGTMEDRAEGKVLEASSLTSVDKGQTVNVASVPPPARPPATGQTTVTGASLVAKEGRIQGYTTAPGGNMDGVLLDNGARVHFPEHVGSAVLPLVQEGKSIRVIGSESRNPQGITIIEATKIVAIPSGESVDIAATPAPRPKIVTPGAVSPPKETTPRQTPPPSAPPAERVR
jgi:hypothetical protein